MPGRALAVARGDEVITLANALGQRFANVVLTQAWHPPGHRSFASTHPGRKPFDTVRMPYDELILWPDHCIQGTIGAAFHGRLTIHHAQLVVRKGWRPDVDSYSTFVEADGKSTTGLAGYLRERGIDTVYLCELATDFCVAWSSLAPRHQERRPPRSS